MKQVYSALHPAEAHIVKGILETHGIECTVKGDILFSARGEIPITQETAPSVWVLEEQRYAEARRLVQEYEKRINVEPAGVVTWQCDNCGEISESQFSHCWKCGLAR